MSFLKKALFYLIGVGLGVLIVIFLFGGRDDIQCSYFPNDRVLYDIRGKEMVIPENIQLKLTEARLDTSDIQDMLRGGKVDFDEVDRETDSCKQYWVHLKRDEAPSFSIQWQNCDSVATAVKYKAL